MSNTTFAPQIRIPFVRKRTPMNVFTHMAVAATPCQSCRFRLFLVFFSFFYIPVQAQQAVSGIITDYNGFWKTSAAQVSNIKPANSHNLLAFTYNGQQYSTGVNDALLSSKGETYVAGDFWSLPVEGYSGTITSDTKVGVGEMYDGVHNGAGPNKPDHYLTSYLTDGIKGLDLGTCVANLPSGTLTFSVANIRPENIGDGIPDIIVTQIADPSGSTDQYSFTNESGQIVGLPKSIRFTNITPVANWTADFYEAGTTPRTLTAGFTNTDRPIRLWAADLSDFGITRDNYRSIFRFRITLSGNSDVAFAAYNNKTLTINVPLPVKLNFFTAQETNGAALLQWQSQSEMNTSHFLIEKSTDNNTFIVIDSIPAAGRSSEQRDYSAVDAQLRNGSSYYRLKMVDIDGGFKYSAVARIQYRGVINQLNAYPNPASGAKVQVSHPAGGQLLCLYNAAGLPVWQTRPATNVQQTQIDLSRLPAGVYYIQWQGKEGNLRHSLLVR